jgi:hypothetical protein
VTTGYSSATSSGNLMLRSANAGIAGVSGMLVLSTGTASIGNRYVSRRLGFCLRCIFTQCIPLL